MPLITDTAYSPPFLFKNGHVQTIYQRFRSVNGEVYQRERIDTPDDDFLDLDWLRQGADRLVVLCHGLEGSTDRSYMRGMAQAFHRRGWDVLAWNYRGRSGEPNRQLRSYHSGATDDLDVVVQHAFVQGYKMVGLIGFSLGGNLALKYVGERGATLDARICAAATFSVPCSLGDACRMLDQPSNWLYRRQFLKDLRTSIRAKQDRYPEALDDSDYDEITSLRAFDDRYTAPIHGFRDAADYYAQSSCLQFIPDISIPTLLINAADDSFLPEICYPVEEARHHKHFHLEVPEYGGHVGFVANNEKNEYWSEQRAVAFFEQVAA